MEIVERNMSKADMRGTAILPGSKLDFGQFSGPGNGHFAGISDASANFLTVLAAPGTYQISPAPRILGHFAHLLVRNWPKSS